MIDIAWNCREANWFLAVRALSAIMNKYNLRNNTQRERRLHEKYCVRTKRWNIVISMLIFYNIYIYIYIIFLVFFFPLEIVHMPCVSIAIWYLSLHFSPLISNLKHFWFVKIERREVTIFYSHYFFFLPFILHDQASRMF